jgi:tyrosyl-tRNA synthetase
MNQHTEKPEKRVAQHLLAREFVELVHGPEDAQAAQAMHLSRSNAASSPSAPTINVRLPIREVIDQPFSSLLFAVGLAESKSKAVKLVESGGAYIIDSSGSAVKIHKGALAREEYLVPTEQGRVLILRAGKWKSRTIGVL